MGLSAEVIFIQLSILIGYIFLFYALGRIFQKKSKFLLDNIWISLFFGFIFYFSISYVISIVLTIFQADLLIHNVFHITKIILLLLLIIYYYNDWIKDLSLIFNREKIPSLIVGVFLISGYLASSIYLSDAIALDSSQNTTIDSIYTEIDRLYNKEVVGVENPNLFMPLDRDINDISNNIFIFNGIYYWSASIMTNMNHVAEFITPENIESIFFVIISATILLSIIHPLLKSIVKLPNNTNLLFSILLSFSIFSLVALIPPLAGIHFAPIFIIGTLFMFLDQSSKNKRKSTNLYIIGLINFSSLFFSTIFVISNITILITMILLLIFSENNFISTSKIYLSVMIIGLSTLLWFSHLTVGILLLLSSIFIGFYFLFTLKKSNKNQLKTEGKIIENKNILIGFVFGTLLVISIILIALEPQDYVNSIKEYFSQLKDVNTYVFTVFVLSLIISVGYGLYNIFTYSINKNGIQKLSLFFGINWLIFLNPIFISITSNIVINDSFWSLSLIYIISLPIFIIYFANLVYYKIKQYGDEGKIWKRKKNRNLKFWEKN